MSLHHMEQVYAKKEVMNRVIAEATMGLSVKDQKIAKHLVARAQSMPSLAGMKTSMLQDADCANKASYDMILGKFTGLAANLTRDKDARVAEYTTTSAEKDSSYTAHIESSSQYYEALERKTSAKKALTFAQGELDKYTTAVSAGKTSYAETIAPMTTEKADLELQQTMIGQIVTLISGMAQPTATKATRASSLAQIKAKVSKLVSDDKMPATVKAQALKMKKMTTALQEVSAATIANAMQILDDMSTEITDRVAAIDKSTAQADANIAKDKASKLKWEVDVVELANTADAEASTANTADLQRNKLEGISDVKAAAFADQADNYHEDVDQFTEEIAGVGSIVTVIQTLVDNC